MCMSTSLAHVEIAETYSTESFLMAMRRFMALHGAPKRFQSDQGTQLVAASKQVAIWDWTSIHEAAEKAEAEWHIVPTGGQHYNGQAERLIGLLKRCLESTMTNRRLTLGGLNTVVAEATQLVNSRPIAKNTGDPETGGPITPLHLQLGRASVEVPRMKFEEAPRLPDSEAAIHRGSKGAVLEEVDAAGVQREDAEPQMGENGEECGRRRRRLPGGGRE